MLIVRWKRHYLKVEMSTPAFLLAFLNANTYMFSTTHPYTMKTMTGILALAIVGWGALAFVARADNDDHDDAKGKVSAAASAKAKVGSNGRICKIAPPGHLIAPGFVKKNEKPTVPACQILPPGIMKKLIDIEKRMKKDKKPDVVAPFILEVRVDNVTENSARIRWETHEKATAQVVYGTSTSYGSNAPFENDLERKHEVMLTGLTANTTYHFKVQSMDAMANLAVSEDLTFATKPTPPTPPADTTAPQLSFVTAFGVTSQSTIIYWMTDERADGQVSYGTTASYGQTTTLETERSRIHVHILTGLAASTTYHFQVRSADASGNGAASADATFTTQPTPPGDTTAPVISDVAVASVTNASANISWKTDELTDGQVSYGTSAAYGSSTELRADSATSHTFALSGLAASTTYHFQVRSRDAAGNLSASNDMTFTTLAPPADTTPPSIADVAITLTTRSTALVSWTTNEATDARVYFSKVSPVNRDTSARISSSAFLSAHVLQLYGLEANTTYYIVVESKDRTGNMTTGAELSFRTLP